MQKQRNVVLDIMRGVAALLIVLFHFTWHYNATAESAGAKLDIGWGVWFGFAAVITFFMLSGFLSARLILSDGGDRKRYIKGRLRRFYPVYWICMTVTVVVLALFYKEKALSVGEWAVNLTMVSRLFGVQYADGAYWSMQYELIFCLYVLLLMSVRDKRKVMRFLCLWMLAAIALNCLPEGDTLPKVVRRVVKILDYAVMSHYCHCFAAGIAIWALMRKHASSAAIAAIVLATVNSMAHTGVSSPEFVLFIVTAALLFLSERLNREVPRNWWGVRAVCYVAGISYPLYLLHEMLGFSVFHQFTQSGCSSAWIILPAFVLVVLSAAAVTAIDRRL